jgi:hypothetical protein
MSLMGQQPPLPPQQRRESGNSVTSHCANRRLGDYAQFSKRMSNFCSAKIIFASDLSAWTGKAATRACAE